MTGLARLALASLGIAVVAGTIADRPAVSPPIELGGYRVLAADFHIHSSTWSDGLLTPWGLVLEAERQGLDVIAITGHIQVSDSRVGRWFSRRIGGPTVLTGEELHVPGRHVVAVGVEHGVDWRADLAKQLVEIHEQHGLAIAAHPFKKFWPGLEPGIGALDGSEVCHPAAFDDPEKQRDLDEFATRSPMAAIGSSDFHGFGRMGACRTYIFASDNSAGAVLDALRAHRTVVYAADGRAHGDPALMKLAEARPELRARATSDAQAGWLDWISRIAGGAGLVGLIVVDRKRS